MWAHSNSFFLTDYVVDNISSYFKEQNPVYRHIKESEVVKRFSSMYGFTFHQEQGRNELFYPHSLYLEPAVISFLETVHKYTNLNEIEFTNGEREFWTFSFQGNEIKKQTFTRDELRLKEKPILRWVNRGWVNQYGSYMCECPFCHKKAYHIDFRGPDFNYNFCPYCGSKILKA